MNRPLTLLAAVATLGAAPLPALAQTWPATAAAAVPVIASDPPIAVAFGHLQPAPERQTPGRTPTVLAEARVAAVLRNRPSVDDAEVPEVRMRPRDEWFDDQGFSLTGQRIAYKRRF